jgi:hypothetical protein
LPLTCAPESTNGVVDTSQISTEQLAAVMRIWSASAIGRYYLDPTIELFQAGKRRTGRSIAAGYYIVPRGRDGCQMVDGASAIDLGPFSSRSKARKWSRTYLTES